MFLSPKQKKLAYLDKNEISDSKKFWMGDNFTVADSYLYVVLTWSDFIGFDLGKEFPRLLAYRQRIADLDFVKEAHQKMANPQ
jgi:glutathione S-transferase